VREVGAELVCSCPAGQREAPCVHAAAVWLKQLGQRACRPAHPARVEAPASRRSHRRNLMSDQERADFAALYG
jgi:hypothetical protein